MNKVKTVDTYILTYLFKMGKFFDQYQVKAQGHYSSDLPSTLVGP